MYYRNHYKFEVISSWNLCTPDIEYMWCKMVLPYTRPTYICGLYRPPDGYIQNAMDLLENKITDILPHRYPDMILVGDTNIDY